MYRQLFILVLITIHFAYGQKISATANSENNTIYAYIIGNDDSVARGQLSCLPEWDNPPQPILSWEINAPNAVDGVDYVKQNGSVASGILWLYFLKISPNITGEYVCVAQGENGTSYTTFNVSLDGSLKIGVIVGIVLISLIVGLVLVASINGPRNPGGVASPGGGDISTVEVGGSCDTGCDCGE